MTFSDCVSKDGTRRGDHSAVDHQERKRQNAETLSQHVPRLSDWFKHEKNRQLKKKASTDFNGSFREWKLKAVGCFSSANLSEWSQVLIPLMLNYAPLCRLKAGRKEGSFEGQRCWQARRRGSEVKRSGTEILAGLHAIHYLISWQYPLLSKVSITGHSKSSIQAFTSRPNA
jgi:hypothetical protein